MSRIIGWIAIALAGYLSAPNEALAQSGTDVMPDAKTVLAMASEIKFTGQPVVGGPVRRAYAPNFRMEVYYHTDMLDLPAHAGAVGSKVVLHGIPEIYGIPDGDYYLWMGRVEGRLRASLTSADGAMQKELCARELPDAKIRVNTLPPWLGATPCDREELATTKVAAVGRMPPGAGRRPPVTRPPRESRPPRREPRRERVPTSRRTLQQICYTENGNKPPVTKYRRGVVWVPDS